MTKKRSEMTPEEIERTRAYHRGAAKKYREKNREKISARSKEKYKRPGEREKCMARDTAWRARRPMSYRLSSMLATIRERCKKKRLEFDLTREWLQPRLSRCEVTGIPFDLSKPYGQGNRAPRAASVDRKDSSRGYTQDNCRVICWALNAAAGTWGLEEFAKIWEHVEIEHE